MQQRLCLKIEGAVQGLGFRPFVYKLATELALTGWVNNSSEGVLIEVEGDRPNTSMKQFAMRDRCLAEYQDRLNRRFHAQPNACPECGPHLEYRESTRAGWS